MCHTCVVCQEDDINCSNVYTCEECKNEFCQDCFKKCYITGGGQDLDVYFCCVECEKIRKERDVNERISPWLNITDEELLEYLLDRLNFDEDKESAKRMCYFEKSRNKI